MTMIRAWLYRRQTISWTPTVLIKAQSVMCTIQLESCFVQFLDNARDQRVVLPISSYFLLSPPLRCKIRSVCIGWPVMILTCWHWRTARFWRRLRRRRARITSLRPAGLTTHDISGNQLPTMYAWGGVVWGPVYWAAVQSLRCALTDGLLVAQLYH